MQLCSWVLVWVCVNSPHWSYWPEDQIHAVSFLCCPAKSHTGFHVVTGSRHLLYHPFLCIVHTLHIVASKLPSPRQEKLCTVSSWPPSAASNDHHMTVTWWSHDNHMTITWQSHDGHMMVTWQSHDHHMIVTWWSHDSHMMVTWWSHDGHTIITSHMIIHTQVMWQ